MSKDHGFHPLRVRRVVQETHDTKSFVFDVPPELHDAFSYEAGQFCTFRIPLGDDELLRCYSMSSSPDVDDEFTLTVKRVPGGRVSNWLLDEVTEGDELALTLPAGVFTLRDHPTPIVAFAGGSGITPVISLVKSALATTDRRVRLLYANRDEQSVIFRAELDALVAEHGDRLEVVHHLDTEQGFVHSDLVRTFVGDELDADFYLCGPAPFMDVIEDALEVCAVASEQVFVERFAFAASVREEPPATALVAALTEPAEVVGTETVTIVLGGRATEVKYQAGETFLETARRAGLRAPFSCESGSCATCMARLEVGEAKMRVNNALDARRGRRGMGAHVPGSADFPDRQGGVRVTRPPTSLPRQLPPRGPVSHPSLKDSAADYLREQILTGQLTPGTKIDQDEISDALGVSRLPVREALIELANEGLVDAVPRRGAFVARLERADIVDHYRVFGLVAGLAASRAATSLTDAQLVELRQVHESFLAATDADAQATWNHEFHKRINRAGGSRRLVSVLALLSRSLPVRYFEFVPGWAAASGRHHDRILAALEQRDAHEAQRVMEHHVTESGELAVEILQEMGYWDGGTESAGTRGTGAA